MKMIMWKRRNWKLQMMNMRDFNLKRLKTVLLLWILFIEMIIFEVLNFLFKKTIVIIVLREPPLQIGNSKTSENRLPWKPPSFIFMEFLKTRGSYSKKKIWKLKKSWGDSLDHLKEPELTVLTKKSENRPTLVSNPSPILKTNYSI
jgi:hypothetical protein